MISFFALCHRSNHFYYASFTTETTALLNPSITLNRDGLFALPFYFSISYFLGSTFIYFLVNPERVKLKRLQTLGNFFTFFCHEKYILFHNSPPE